MPYLKVHVMGDCSAVEDRIGDILSLLVSQLSQIETVKPPSVKGLILRAESFAAGEGGPVGALAVEACILRGRSAEIRAAMADALFACLQSELLGTPIYGSVEIREMDESTYRQ